MKKLLLCFTVLIICISFSACGFSADGNVLENPSLKVHFIDVGQGDSIFIELPDSKTMLIDCGEYEYAGFVSDYIKNLGYSSLDYAVATHPHTDHMGGMATLIKKFKPQNFYMPDAAHDTLAFDKMLEAVANSGCNAEYAVAGKLIFDLNGARAEFLAPHKNSFADFNNLSAVIKLTYKNSSFLFTGDAEYYSEGRMISAKVDLSADVLKCGHHGSSSSTGEKFLNKVNPKYAVISAGKDNSYGHPHIETIAKLDRMGVEYYLTSEAGTVVISTDGEAYAVQTIKTADNRNIADYTKVYRTKKGKRYHIEGCDGLKYTKIPTTIEEAESMGLTPCNACMP